MSQEDRSTVMRVLEQTKGDLRALASESRRKQPQVKEAAEAAIVRIGQLGDCRDLRREVMQANSDLVRPVLLACSCKQPKLVNLALQALQRMLSARLLSDESGAAVVLSLWSLMEEGIEEVRLLQTVMLLVSNCPSLVGRPLAKALALVLRLHFGRSAMVAATAAASIRQCLTALMERVMAEDAEPACGQQIQPAAEDARSFLLDLCLLVNAEQPQWLQGLTHMTRTLGLELLHSALADFGQVFTHNAHFRQLLKEHVCPLIIRLFGPSSKPSAPGGAQAAAAAEAGGTAVAFAAGQPASLASSFPILVRLHRLVCVLLHTYFDLVSTECEIFLTLLIRLVDAERLPWQRVLALEVLHKVVQKPSLVAAVCEAYDMKDHASKVFADLGSALAACVQSVFTSPRDSAAAASAGASAVKETPPAVVGGMQVGPGASPASSFFYKGMVVPLHTNPKSTFLEMLEKQEAPQPADGLALSLAFYSMVELVRSVQSVVEGRCAQLQEQPSRESPPELHRILVTSLWCPALAALALLLETSTDESATESILKSLETLVSLCGRLGLTTPRDAFITAMCKASLPPNYALAVLTSAAASSSQQRSLATSRDALGQSDQPAAGSGQSQASGSRDYNQVVVVGSALPTSAGTPSSAELGKVHLTAKNMQCMRAILSVAHCQGAVLGTAWHLLLTTLQHLAWVLGLKPVPGGGLVPTKGSGDTSTVVVTTAVVGDLSVLSSMLSRLFESSQFLDDVALHHLISALCKLSSEAMELAASNKEPSLFAVAKLQETGLVNLKRLEVLWKPVTHHLLEVAGHSHPGLRGIASDALVSLVKAGVEFDSFDGGSLWENERLGSLVLEPLFQLSRLHADVRSKQLHCLQHLLNVCGHRLGPHWRRFVEVVGEIGGHESHSEAHIRLAFRCLQQILTDFLSSLGHHCYESCINVTASFARQQQDLNIALTAVACIWNVTDCFFNQPDEESPAKSGDGEASHNADDLWICVQVKLKDLCLDPRPAVRKSASQTLFNTIASHGKHLRTDTWKVVLWKVLFPLLESVSEAALAAADADALRPLSEQPSAGILMHHSRDTVGKQWAETQTLTLAGVASVFKAQQALLLTLNDFSRAWKLLLECIEQSALSSNAEIAKNALSSFQELANLDSAADSEQVLWTMAWQSWLRIAQESSCCRRLLPSQDFLTSLCRLLPSLFNRVSTAFTQKDFAQLAVGLNQALVCPILSDSKAPYILPTNYYDSGLTPLQESVVEALQTLARAFLMGPDCLRCLLPSLFDLLLTFANFSVHTPKPAKLPEPAGRSDTYLSLSYVTFGERCYELVVELYADCAGHPVVVEAGVLEAAFRALRQPLGIKYNCPAQSTWRLAYKCLVDLIYCGTPVARQHPAASRGMWDALSLSVEDFLFAPHKYPPGLTVEDFEEHEALDCRLVSAVRDEFLSKPEGVPAEFIDRTISLLNRGSIHSVPVSSAADFDLQRWLREELAQLCFHTLLSYSFQAEGGPDGAEARGAVSRAAVRTILSRCRDVLAKFVEDQRLSGHCPLPRARLTEVGLSLKALSSLLTAFKAAPQERVDPQAWRILLDCYPAVVDSVLPNCTNFIKPLKELLHLYADLLRPPLPNN